MNEPTGLNWLGEILQKASGIALISLFQSVSGKIGENIKELSGSTPTVSNSYSGWKNKRDDAWESPRYNSSSYWKPKQQDKDDFLSEY